MEITAGTAVLVGIATISASVVSATVAVFGAAWKMQYRFVPRDHCETVQAACYRERAQRRRGDDQRADTLTEDLREIKATIQSHHREAEKSNRVQYYMIRSLVAHAPDLTADERAKILNAGNGGGGGRANRD